MDTEIERELSRLYALDQDSPREGISRLLEYTIANRLNDKGRFEMARTKGSTNKPKTSSQAKQLSEALAFVSVAATKDDMIWKKHVEFNNKFAFMTDGQITAGHPITEDLECCPQYNLMVSALSKCGHSLNITELDNGSLVIKGDMLRATVPCLSFEEMPSHPLMVPDPPIAVIDDRLKAAFSVCGTLVSEAGDTVLKAAVMLEAWYCTAFNGPVIIQYQHGINLPPNLVLPKLFTAAIAKSKLKLVGFGYTPDVSVTFYFDNHAWIKTLVYNDKYPIADINSVLNVQTDPQLVHEQFFDAINTVADFRNDDGVFINDEGIFSDFENGNTGAAFELKGLNCEIGLNRKFTQMIAPFVKKIDLKSREDKAFFFGENMRGVLAAYQLASKPVPQGNFGQTGAAQSDADIPF